MKTLLTATLEVPPSVNALYGQRAGQRYKQPGVLAYQYRTLAKLRDASQDRACIDAARSSRQGLSVSMRAFLPEVKYRQRDVDNLAKIALDTICNIYLKIDDSQVTDLWLSKRPLEAGAVGSLLVEVMVVESEKNDGPLLS